VTVAEAQQTPPEPAPNPKRWVGRVQPPADPLDPWPLEDAPSTPQPSSAPQPAAAESLGAETPLETAETVAIDSTDVVVVVRCRQILIEDPQVPGSSACCTMGRA
jgi:hypothetical protein